MEIFAWMTHKTEIVPDDNTKLLLICAFFSAINSRSADFATHNRFPLIFWSFRNFFATLNLQKLYYDSHQWELVWDLFGSINLPFCGQCDAAFCSISAWLISRCCCSNEIIVQRARRFKLLLRDWVCCITGSYATFTNHRGLSCLTEQTVDPREVKPSAAADWRGIF